MAKKKKRAGKLKTYLVDVREVWVQRFRVEARSRDEAVMLVGSTGEVVPDAFEFLHTLDTGDVEEEVYHWRMRAPKRQQHQYDVTLKSGQAEAVVLVAAMSALEAGAKARARVALGDVCWEGKPGKRVRIADVQDLGPDDAGEV
jgi:hypothetical protein